MEKQADLLLTDPVAFTQRIIKEPPNEYFVKMKIMDKMDQNDENGLDTLWDLERLQLI